VPGSGPHRGRREIIDDFLTPLRDSLFEPGTVSGGVDTLISKGGLVAAESQASARLKNGKSYHNRYVFVFEIRDGSIAAVREYMDSHYIVERLKS
jgi:ketosteroid isomerase-like protein